MDIKELLENQAQTQILKLFNLKLPILFIIFVVLFKNALNRESFYLNRFTKIGWIPLIENACTCDYGISMKIIHDKHERDCQVK